MKEKLLEMLKMQQALNVDILKKHGSEKYTDENLYHALIDEIGELNHELKGDWCWWKNTQKPVDRDKVLEEYVDCIHFGLCRILRSHIDRHFISGLIVDVYMNTINNIFQDNRTISKYMENILEYDRSSEILFVDLLLLGKKLGFDFDTIYNAYINKNKVNYERLKNGY